MTRDAHRETLKNSIAELTDQQTVELFQACFDHYVSPSQDSLPNTDQFNDGLISAMGLTISTGRNLWMRDFAALLQELDREGTLIASVLIAMPNDSLTQAQAGRLATVVKPSTVMAFIYDGNSRDLPDPIVRIIGHSLDEQHFAHLDAAQRETGLEAEIGNSEYLRYLSGLIASGAGEPSFNIARSVPEENRVSILNYIGKTFREVELSLLQRESWTLAAAQIIHTSYQTFIPVSDAFRGFNIDDRISVIVELVMLGEDIDRVTRLAWDLPKVAELDQDLFADQAYTKEELMTAIEAKIAERVAGDAIVEDDTVEAAATPNEPFANEGPAMVPSNGLEDFQINQIAELVVELRTALEEAFVDAKDTNELNRAKARLYKIGRGGCLPNDALDALTEMAQTLSNYIGRRSVVPDHPDFRHIPEPTRNKLTKEQYLGYSELLDSLSDAHWGTSLIEFKAISQQQAVQTARDEEPTHGKTRTY